MLKNRSWGDPTASTFIATRTYGGRTAPPTPCISRQNVASIDRWLSCVKRARLSDKPAWQDVQSSWRTVNNRLRVLRAERNWTQADLARYLRVSRQSINAIETGRHNPGLALAFRIARLFGQPIEAIFLPE